jgi:hypothetical protein
MPKSRQREIDEMLDLLNEMAGELMNKIHTHNERGEAIPALEASLLFEHIQNLIILLSCYKEFGKVPERFKRHTLEDISAHIDDIIRTFGRPAKPKKVLGIALADENVTKN